MISPAAAEYRAVQENEVNDLSVLLSSNYPCWWQGHPEYVTIPYRKIGPAPWRSSLTIIDEHTGTHFDAPAHWIPPLKSGLPHATVYGDITGDKVPVWQFAGEACVIDVSPILDQAPNGRSPIITRAMVQEWEQQYRSLAGGDVVIFRSGYNDKYYRPFPEGSRLVAEPREGKAPAFPAPDAECVEYIVGKGVKTIGIDSPAMGPFPDGAETRYAGLGAGAIFCEQLIGLGSLSPTGGFFIFLPVKLEGSSGGPGRAVAITAGALAGSLIHAVKGHRIVDLSVIDSPECRADWPGLYMHLVADFTNWSSWKGPYFNRTHLIDAHMGTHFDPPTHFLPDAGFDNEAYDDWTQSVLKEFEQSYGKRECSSVYAADYPLHQMMGPARVIDVSHLLGTTSASAWPMSPTITVDDVKRHEKLYGPIEAGEVALFRSGWTDLHYQRGVYASCVADALGGKAEGWHAPTPETMLYLAEKGVKCVGTDGASLGAVTGKEAVLSHWAGLSRGMNYPEFLTNLGALPPKGAFFIGLPLKQEGVPGGAGRAVAILP